MSTRATLGRRRAPVDARGFSLIELMIAMVLGLVVISGVTSVFLANQQTYRANAALSDVQEGSRIAFEMLARDIRGAGLTGCDSTSGRVSNVLDQSGGTLWYADWSNAVHGYDGSETDPAVVTGTAAGQRVAGTDSLHIISAGSLAATVGVNSGNDPARIFLNQATDDITEGDLVMVCDYDHAAIFQISQFNDKVTVVHNTGSDTPGNCTKGLGYPVPVPCKSGQDNTYTFPPNSQIAKLSASDWYIGYNPAGGKSLYRITLSLSSGKVTTTAQEMVRNVTDLQITYHQQGGATFDNTAATITASGSGWPIVDAARVTLTLESTNKRAGVNAQAVSRQFTAVATVRNRAQ